MQRLILIAVVVILTSLSGFYLSENKTTSKQPSNIILISIDTLSGMHLNKNGYHRSTTPNLDQFISESIMFNKAFSTSSYTFPGHMAMFTGQSIAMNNMVAFKLEDRAVILPKKIKTITEYLKKQDFKTAWFAPTQDYQLDLTRGFERSFDILETTAKEDGFLNKSRKEWIEKNKDSKKFMFLHSYLVHDPYIPPKPYYKKYDPDYKGRIIGEMSEFEELYNKHNKTNSWNGKLRKKLYFERVDINDSRDLIHMTALYDEEIEFQDYLLGQFFAYLRRESLYDNSVIIVTSDHGEAFGQHNELRHNTLHNEVIQVPLIIKIPGIKPKAIQSHVQLIDLAPTILDLLSLKPRHEFEGKSMMPLIDGSVEKLRDHTITIIDPSDMKAIHTTDYKYILHTSGKRELYNLKEDWKEKNNIIKDNEDIAQDLHTVLFNYITKVKK